MNGSYVVLRTPSTPRLTRDIFRGPGPRPRGVEDEVPSAIRVDVEDIDRRGIAELARDPDVQAVAPSIPMKLVEPVEKADVTGASQATSWGVVAVGASTSPFTGNGVVVAVLDTGIDRDHPAFAGVTIIEEDFTGEGNGDADGHGTHCAGTILGRDVNGTRIGVAPGVRRLLAGKVIGSDGGSSGAIVQAIQWAVDNGAHVISMSLGIDFPGFVAALQAKGLPTELATSRALEGYRANVMLFERQASLLRAQSAFGQPVLTVAAAGNESRRSENDEFEIAVSPPAVSEGVISVAALGESAQGFVVAFFSNTGANVSGPGVRIVSAKVGGGLASMSGTSMATPHVAGIAALWAEKLNGMGMFNTFNLANRLVGSCVTDGLRSGFDPFDVGLGLVRAPQA